MEEIFINEQAKKFAKHVAAGVGKYDDLKNLKTRLYQELDTYEDSNKIIFLKIWHEELNLLFQSHLSRCEDEKCPQRLTSKNAEFLVSQLLPNSLEKRANKMKSSFDYDLNFYFNIKNIANTDLVMQTYSFFLKGKGKKYFEPLTFFNLLYWHYHFLKSNIERPFDVLNQLRNVDLDEVRRQVLLGFILKWFGGWPVNNLNGQYDHTLKLIESDYLDFNGAKLSREIELKEKKKAGVVLTSDEMLELGELQELNGFLRDLFEVIANAKERKELAEAESVIQKALFPSNDSIQFSDSKSTIDIFISHSSKDKEIVELFVDKILRLSLGIEIENIFCTSIDSTTIATGDDFRSVIKQRLIGASHVIQIISENYKASEVCLNEMGAVWVLNSKVIPFILPPVSYDTVGFIHLPNQLAKLNEEKDLLKFIDEMKDVSKGVKHTEVVRHISDFVKRLSLRKTV